MTLRTNGLFLIIWFAGYHGDVFVLFLSYTKSSQTLCFQGMIKLVLLNCVRFCLSKDCVTRRRSDKKPNLHLKWMETWMKRKNEIRRKPVLSMFSGSGSHLLSGRPAVRIRSRTPVFSGGSRLLGTLFQSKFCLKMSE